MRLPFLQVSQEEMARARTLAGYLGVLYVQALGMVVSLKAAALEAAPEDDVSGAIQDPNPAEWMAVQCGWPLDRAEALAVALVRCGFAMAGPSGGHSVAGMEPYAKALDTSEKRSEAGRRGAAARKEKGGYSRAMAGPKQSDGHGMARDAKTQTQTQKEEALSAGADLFPVADATTKPKRSKPEPKTSETEREGRKRLEAVYAAKRGGEVLPWDGGAWVSLRECIALAGGDVAKVEARFSRGLDLAAAQKWGGASTVHQLKTRWADLASLDVSSGAQPASAEDEKARLRRETWERLQREKAAKAAGGGT